MNISMEPARRRGSRRRRRSGGLLLLSLAAFLLVPAVGSASTVFASADPAETAVFQAGGGEENALEVDPVVGGLEFSDAVGLLSVGPGCTPSPGGGAFCEGARFVDAYLQDGNDDANVIVNAQARVFAGAGDDHVVADAFGGATLVYGEAGNDEIAAGGEGGQLADGGPGNDIVHAGGFAGQASGLGGPGNDIIQFHTVFGGLATIEGGPGDDTITSNPTDGTVDGGPGNDVISIAGLPTIIGGTAGFVITGGPGDDMITAGIFGDTVDAGAGNDYIDVFDGGADTVSCGAGNDTVRYDPSDTIAGDCETLVTS
jgi:Ca2+-binding RTX toxin-like protein